MRPVQLTFVVTWANARAADSQTRTLNTPLSTSIVDARVCQRQMSLTWTLEVVILNMSGRVDGGQVR